MTQPDRQHRHPSRVGPVSDRAYDEATLFDEHDADPIDTHTDLPLTLRVNGGNHCGARDVEREEPGLLLDEAMQRLPDPSIDLLDAQAVVDWIGRATERLTYRRDRRRLAREAMRVLERDFQTAMNVGRLRQQLDRQEADRCARQAGTYWAERDKRRSAQQPTHVEVDPAAWRAMRGVAARRGRSIGHEVGALVVAEVSHPSSASGVAIDPGRREHEGGRRATVFARLVVTKPTWNEFRALALERTVTVARYAGILVERERKG